MKPILINGHERSLTQITYNREGDLLFSVSKDKVPTVWFAHNGERLGTYEGHNGAVWCCSVDYTSTKFISGCADNFFKLWDVQTGKCLADLEMKTAVRTCDFSYDGTKLFLTTDATRGQPCFINVYDVKQLQQEGLKSQPLQSVPIKDSTKKVTSAIWGLYDESIITGHANGDILQWDLNTLKPQVTSPHSATVTDLQASTDMTSFLSASKDSKASLIDMDNLSILKTYESPRPVNSASLSPTHDYVVLGGGQEARDVTTTAGSAGKFEARFYHKIFTEELGHVKGHFGPINTVRFSPDGKGYTSGGEDGYIRIHRFDKSYFDFQFEC
jgi:translation initiation factor 3 subunit I